MKHLTIFCFVLSLYGATDLASGRSPLPMDPPTPPPCAADGTCYPRTAEWGWYPARWRTWPGTQLEPTPSSIAPTPADGRVSPELGHAETPPADVEDAAAPPSSPKREVPIEPPPQPSETAPKGDMPDVSLPDVPLPDDETSLFGPTSDHDPPPALPKSMASRTRAAGNRQAATLTGGKPDAARVSSNDPPPAPPWGQSASL